jgi:HEAT repeats
MSIYPKILDTKDPVSNLIETLSKGSREDRLQAAQFLGMIKDTQAVYALVYALEDEDHDVRWAAMEALIALNQACLEPLLQALMKDFESVWLREGAHHILHQLLKKGSLTEPVVRVFTALEGIEPFIEVPWAAEAAWEELFRSQKYVNREKQKNFTDPVNGSS